MKATKPTDRNLLYSFAAEHYCDLGSGRHMFEPEVSSKELYFDF